ncbi:amidase [Bradyrhizobium sp. AZCC 2262]|uniref:amidase n=1 Tax=Bradyrhizobium sp. AZCC 2262 TaxID=3117022 RepID=UPI002FF0F9B6
MASVPTTAGSVTGVHYATLLETADAIKSRKISPVELTKAMLDRVARLEPSLHSYATVTSELALSQAFRAEAEIAAGHYRGPLHGIPVAVKDIYNTADIATTAGMAIFAGHKPNFDATVVKRLADAGSVLLGKLQLTEGAFAKHHPAVEAPKNPWNADYYAGASSSGSGVATAAGLTFGSLGSDTGGSIRYPASANGVTGLKPTWGRVSRYGVFPLAPSMDHVGPLTRSAADAGAMLGVIAGRDANDPTTLIAPVPDYLANLGKGVRGLRIGIDPAYNEMGVDADIVQALRETRRVLQGIGATIQEVKMPDYEAVTAGWGVLAGVEAAIGHHTTYPSRASEYGPPVSGSISGLIDYGRTVSAVDLMKVNHDRLIFTGELTALLSDVDLLLIPTQPLADFTIKQEAELFTKPAELSAFLRFATPFDMSGNPTLTMPNGFTAKGLPLSFQFVCRHLDEGLLVRAGDAYQQATDWHRRHPRL